MQYMRFSRRDYEGYSGSALKTVDGTSEEPADTIFREHIHACTDNTANGANGSEVSDTVVRCIFSTLKTGPGDPSETLAPYH
jgi:hypothetical protein